MAIVKLWEPWCVNYLRTQVRDSLAYHGEEAILLQMYHPDDDVGRCPRCYQDAYNDNEPLCPVCYGTGRYDEERRVGGVRQATRAWCLFTDHPVAEQYGQRGVLKPDTRQVTCEAFPLLTEHDFIARVRRWDPLTHTALSTPKFYSLQTVTQDSLRTGNRFGQTWEDVVGQTAQCSWLPPKSHGIQLFPIKGVAFPQAKISGVPVPTVTPQPDSHVIFYPVRDPAGTVIGGTAGPFEQSYTFTQQVPSTTWRISHTLGHLPDVTIVVGGEEVDADVDYPSTNEVVITFGAPQQGTAELV